MTDQEFSKGCDLVQERNELKLRAERAESERDKALACVAEMRYILTEIETRIIGIDEWRHALSTDCGKGWLSPQQVADAIAKAVAETESKSTVVQLQAKQIKLLVEALERIKDDRSSYWCHFAADTLAAVKGQP